MRGPITLLLLLAGLSALGQSATTSVLASGKWYKFSVMADGIYKIDYNLLKAAGVNPDKIDPKKIRLYASGNGMLPQANDASRIDDLKELAISVVGEEDGNFSKDDFILFYGQDPDVVEFLPSKNIFRFENNIYSDKNFYFLTVSDQNGKRVSTSVSVGGSYPSITQYDDFAYYENDKTNIRSSGREWFGEQFDNVTEIRIKFDVANVVDNSTIKLVSHVMSQSNESTSFKVVFNGTEVGQQNILPIPNSQYGIKGRKAMDTISFVAANVSGMASHEVKYQYIKGPTARSIGFLDMTALNVKRKLLWSGKNFSFLSSESLTNAISSFQIPSFPETGEVWDVSDPFEVKRQVLTTSSGVRAFNTETTKLKKFTAFESVQDFPKFESEIANQNLHNSGSVDLLIVTHRLFQEQATRLAAHRESYNHLKVKVATVDEIYNEYSGGKQDITAIRDYARSLYLSGGLKNLLLFGRCSYDYKDRVVDNTNFVPTYESRESLSPLETYSSDDYFGFFESSEGTWGEVPVQNHTMEIGVGRLSVKKVVDAENIVDKLISYDLNKNARGSWRNDILFVADDGDFNEHMRQADQMADDIELDHPEFNSIKLFIDYYKQNTRPSGQYATEANEELIRSINKGALIVNYTGHGSEKVWMQERILQASTLEEFRNKNNFPLFVTATCEFGVHDDPAIISSGEMMMTKKNAGAIGLVTTSRPVFSNTNFLLNQAFYQAFFEKQNGRYKDLGAIFRDTKNQSLSTVGNRNFSLLGDPSMHLAMPEDEMIVTEIKTVSGSDTLKAQSEVVIKGHVKTNSFDGIAQVKLFDKKVQEKTRGDENPVFTFDNFSHLLFQGSATVENGLFEAHAIIPKNIDTSVGYGKLSVYAYSKSGEEQASGATVNFKIGKSELIVDNDTQGPNIELFMGDTTYVPAGAVGANTFLVAKLYDAHGINISGFENGNLEITLDDTLTFSGNRFYESGPDSYRDGFMRFPINNLAAGSHQIKFKAWDTYGNASEKMITFSSGEANTLAIDSFSGYPNPIVDRVTLRFSHNRPGEDLEGQWVIFNSTGAVVNSATFTVTESMYSVTIGEWDGTTNGTKLTNGIYFVKLMLRSLSDGAKNEKFTKLILLN